VGVANSRAARVRLRLVKPLNARLKDTLGGCKNMEKEKRTDEDGSKENPAIDEFLRQSVF
jgi:hypothetical protein